MLRHSLDSNLLMNTVHFLRDVSSGGGGVIRNKINKKNGNDNEDPLEDEGVVDGVRLEVLVMILQVTAGNDANSE